MSHEPVPAVDAATVILVSPSSRAPFEVFLVKRHAKSSFMANAYVYPGGRLEPSDGDADTLAQTTGLDAEMCGQRLGEPAKHAQALYVAALRESFEEAGVLFAHAVTDPDRVLIDPCDETLRPLVERWRSDLNDGSASWHALGESQQWRWPLDRLRPFARWVTPEPLPKRFDARFFIARCPRSQRDVLAHDAQETVASVWLTPQDALAGHTAGEMILEPPTVRTLETLASFDDLDALWDYSLHASMVPVLPKPRLVDGELQLLLPGDPEFGDAVSPPPGWTSSRLIRQGRHWRSV